MNRKILGDLICPNLKNDYIFYLNKYKKRDNKFIVRFAPSPTGFLHTGSLYMALVNYKMSIDNDGIFYIRIEDTDTKREISGSKDLIFDMLKEFNIIPNNDSSYGPYIQSLRKDIYDAFIYKLILEDKAYPCFCTKEELDNIRKEQENNNKRTGYYKEYALYRNYPLEESIKRIKNNEEYVIRLKSNGVYENTFIFNDKLRNDISFHENDFDIVIRKSDGLPTYHFAHVIDDYLMGTTLVIRGEEWLNSIPIHYELFDVLGFKKVEYMHLSSILKQTENGFRKLSKRYDEEASVSYLLSNGYPKKAIINYLLLLSNSKYEDTMNFKNKLDINNFSKNGSTFDILKLDHISKEYISNLDLDSLYNEVYEYASLYDNNLLKLINYNKEYFKKILNLEYYPSKRKDYSKYSDIYNKIFYFYDSLFKEIEYEEIDIDNDTLNKLFILFKDINNLNSEEEWISFLKESSYSLGFGKNKKDKELNNLKYIFSDLMKVLRIILCKKNESFSLYEVIKIIGIENYLKRIDSYQQLV